MSKMKSILPLNAVLLRTCTAQQFRRQHHLLNVKNWAQRASHLHNKQPRHGQWLPYSPLLTSSLHQRRCSSRNAGQNSESGARTYSSFTTAIIALAGIAGVTYLSWHYIFPAKYPEPVAQKLRKALHYTNIDLQPVEAVRYYREALDAAEQCGMNSWSDEVIGIKLNIVQVMELVNQNKPAITALEAMRTELLTHLKTLELAESVKTDRERLLSWAVRWSFKLGELYSLPQINNKDAAEHHLSWAVETLLKKAQNRSVQSDNAGDRGQWPTNEQLGATMEALAEIYESKNQQYLAAPLLLHAINLRTSLDCHTVVLMTNLAASLSQQTPNAAAAVQTQLDTGMGRTVPLSRSMLLEMARIWAQKALDTAGQIKPPVRDAECDMGCAVALHNLGEIAEMLRDFDLARRKYGEAISLSRAIAFDEGVEQSSARLRELQHDR